MNLPVLSRIRSTRVFTESIPPAFGGFLTFLTFDSAPPAQLTIAEAWNTAPGAGYFVLLAEAPSDLNVYALALQATNLLPKPDHTGFAWAQFDPASQSLQFPLVIRLNAAGAVPADTPAAFRNYGLLLREGTQVTLDGAAFLFIPPVTGAGSSAQMPQLSFDGNSRFCWQSEGLINDFSDSQQTGWDVAIRFYSAASDGSLRFWRYPLIQNPAPGVFFLFRMTWDPLRPLDDSRTFLAFTRTEIQISGQDIVPAPDTKGAFALGRTCSLAL